VDAIVVNTETGSSLKAHNLRIIETLLTSTTRFVAGEAAWADEWKRHKLESLQILLVGAMNASTLVSATRRPRPVAACTGRTTP